MKTQTKKTDDSHRWIGTGTEACRALKTNSRFHVARRIVLVLLVSAVGTALASTDLETATPIKHLVVIFQETHSFDASFAPYPGARSRRWEELYIVKLLPIWGHVDTCGHRFPGFSTRGCELREIPVIRCPTCPRVQELIGVTAPTSPGCRRPCPS